MKRVVITGIAVVMLLGLSSRLRAQEGLPPRLKAARDAAARELQQEMPGWLRQSITPMEGSNATAIDHWELGSFAVKVAIEMAPSQEAAADAFEKGKRHLKVEEDATRSRGRSDFHVIKEKLTDVGQDGYSWEDRYGATAVAFRENNFIIYVSVVRPSSNKDNKLSKEFARHVAKALRSM